MTIVVFGAGGALGSAVMQEAGVGGEFVGEVVGVTHDQCSITSLASVASVIADLRPTAVINCAGAIPGALRSSMEAAEANAIGPYVLATACAAWEARLIHVSTDCVFRKHHRRRSRYPKDVPDAADFYGLAKALGEVRSPWVTNVRTSFVTPRHGLWAWLAGRAPGEEIDGWTEAWWSGSTVWAVARRLVRMAADGSVGHGTYHLATPSPISKHEAIGTMMDALGFDVRLRASPTPSIHRGLIHSPELGEPLRPFDSAMLDFIRSNS